MNRNIVILSCTILLFASVGFSQTSTTPSGIEKALRELDAQWSAAASAKDVDKTVSYYSDDAIVLAPNSPVLTTKDAIRSIWNGLLTTPGASVSWKVTRVEVAKSGDMAYVSGTYELTMNDSSGKPVNDRGKYLEVWEKQSNGDWKCGADAWNTDLEAPTAPEKK